jgi:hypothetical protein
MRKQEDLDYYELQLHVPLFDEECSKLLDQKKQAKVQWLVNLSRDSMSNVRHECCKTLGTWKTKQKWTRNKEYEQKYYTYIYLCTIRGCIQKFPDWQPGARTANGKLSATRCSCMTILWVSLVSFAAITLCVASRVFIVVYFVIDSVRNTPSCVCVCVCIYIYSVCVYIHTHTYSINGYKKCYQPTTNFIISLQIPIIFWRGG